MNKHKRAVEVLHGNRRIRQVLAKSSNKILELAQCKQHLDVYLQSSIPSVILSSEGEIVEYNRAMASLTGYTHERIPDMSVCVGRPYHDEEYQNKATGASGTHRHRGLREAKDTFIITRKDGEQRYVEFSVYQVLLDGEPTGLILVQGQDITERKRVEEELRETVARCEEFADLLPQIVFITDESGNVIYANHCAFTSFGCRRENLERGLNVVEVVIGEDRGRAREQIQQVLRGGQLGPSEYTARKQDGSAFPILAYINAILHVDKAIGLKGVALDITELKRVDNALQQSERYYRDIFNHSSDAIVIRDLKGNIIEVSQSASGLTGYTVEELREMNISELITPQGFENTMQRQQEQLKGEIGSQRHEMELIRKDGAKRAIELVSRLLYEGGEVVGVQATARDVTEQKRLGQNLRLFISEIIKAQEGERRRIARELHDDTIQSLVALSLDIDGIITGKGQLSGRIIRRLEQVRAKIGSIAEEVRRFCCELRPDVLDQLGLLPALDLLIAELNEGGLISARIEVLGFERRLPPEVELALFRIAQEALRNARKHSQATEVLVRINFGWKKVKVDITDNGCGFELPEVLSDFAAMGKLGLIGMRERIRVLNGHFSLKSQVGKGTTVTVEIAG